MTAPRVELILAGQVVPLSTDGAAPQVPEGIVQLLVDAQPSEIAHDDVRLRATWDATAKLSLATIDLTNDVGFHRITVSRSGRRYSFDYETASAKATWKTVLRMADWVAGNVYNYRRQFVYSLPTGQRRTVRIPQVEFGWIRERLDEIEALTTGIARRPGKEVHNRTTTSLRADRVSVARTLQFLRERPHFLEQHPAGTLVIGERTYLPTQVRSRTRTTRNARKEHHQLAQLLRNVALVANSLVADVPAEIDRIRDWQRTVARLRALPIVIEHDSSMTRSPSLAIPTQLERSDSRYGRLREIAAEARQALLPSTLQRSARDSARLNIKDVSEIFQTYVCQAIGKALNTRCVDDSGDLRIRDAANRSMHSDHYDVYYDVHPPTSVLESWRDDTVRPAGERPDVLVVDRTNDMVALVDAKLAADVSDRANNSHLAEMQAYLQSFELRRGAIAFAGKLRAHTEISSGQNVLLEIPMLPPSDASKDAEVIAHIQTAIGRLWQPRPA